MAEYLASIFATEKDKVNCSFYFKIGACQHGVRCSRIHNRPTFSQTVLLQNLYINPQNLSKSADGSHLAAPVSEEDMQDHFDNFYEDIFVECEHKYGDIEEMFVCDNLGDHLIGNVYIKFSREKDAQKAVDSLNNRWFGGRPIYAELSPVTDFSEACCRQFEVGECLRSGFCNFMHLKTISSDLRVFLFGGRGCGTEGSGRRSRRVSRDHHRRSKRPSSRHSHGLRHRGQGNDHEHGHKQKSGRDHRHMQEHVRDLGHRSGLEHMPERGVDHGRRHGSRHKHGHGQNSRR